MPVIFNHLTIRELDLWEQLSNYPDICLMGKRCQRTAVPYYPSTMLKHTNPLAVFYSPTHTIGTHFL